MLRPLPLAPLDEPTTDVRGVDAPLARPSFDSPSNRDDPLELTVEVRRMLLRGTPDEEEVGAEADEDEERVVGAADEEDDGVVDDRLSVSSLGDEGGLVEAEEEVECLWCSLCSKEGIVN